MSGELWALVAPLLPARPACPKGGHPPVDDRVALTGIIFVLKSGIPWEMWCNIESSQRLGRHRWKVERTQAWIARFQRIVVPYERRSDIFAAFHHLAAVLITFRFVQWYRCC